MGARDVRELARLRAADPDRARATELRNLERAGKLDAEGVAELEAWRERELGAKAARAAAERERVEQALREQQDQGGAS
jgi:hypothetical protein